MRPGGAWGDFRVYDEQGVRRSLYLGKKDGDREATKAQSTISACPLVTKPTDPATFRPNVLPLGQCHNYVQIAGLREMYRRGMQVHVRGKGGKTISHPSVDKFIRQQLKRSFQSIESLAAEFQVVPPSAGGRGGGAVFLATDDEHGCAVGMVAIRPYFNNGGEKAGVELRHMCVEANYRRCGVGTALLKRAVIFCRGKGYPSITLETLEPMAAARGLYARHGFEEVKRTVLGNGNRAFTLIMYRKDFGVVGGGG
jgi:GNAT superfamily N-acetyltransferase|eukprot:g745.t1